MTRQERIATERERLEVLCAAMDTDRIDAAQQLISNAAFMAVTLEDLQDEINENGAVCEYRNSETQYGTRKNPAIEVYNSTMRNFMAVMRALVDLLPSNDEPEKDELLEFIAQRQRR